MPLGHTNWCWKADNASCEQVVTKAEFAPSDLASRLHFVSPAKLEAIPTRTGSRIPSPPSRQGKRTCSQALSSTGVPRMKKELTGVVWSRCPVQVVRLLEKPEVLQTCSRRQCLIWHLLPECSNSLNDSRCPGSLLSRTADSPAAVRRAAPR